MDLKEEALKAQSAKQSIESPAGPGNISTDPLFDNLRDEPEFQEILSDVEAKYQAGHERVRPWLKKKDLI